MVLGYFFSSPKIIWVCTLIMGCWKEDLNQTKSTHFLSGHAQGEASATLLLKLDPTYIYQDFISVQQQSVGQKISLPEKVKEVRSVWEKTRNVGEEGKCDVLYLGILRKIVREDKRVSYAYFWSQRHYYVLVAFHFSHHPLAVALPSGKAHGRILFLWMFSVSLWWMFLALIDWAPCSVSPRAA